MYSNRHNKRLVAAEIKNMLNYKKINNSANTENRQSIYCDNISYENEINIESTADPVEENICDDLKNWGSEHNITRNAFNSLLSILKKYDVNVPKSCETIYKKTKNPCIVRTVSPGKYIHFGLEVQLQKLSDVLKDFQTIQLDINIDGLPLFKSSQESIWPILAKVFLAEQADIIIIGVYLGKNKPFSVNCFLHDFVVDIKLAYENGITILGKKMNVVIRSFICDTPAKSFLCQTIGHNALQGCSRCTQIGKRIQNTTSYSTIRALPRTNEDFSLRKYEGYHKTVPDDRLCLEDIGIKMVTQFVLDPMHLVDLGVTKKMLVLLVNGKNKINKNMVAKISEILTNLNACVPKEFARKPRSLSDLCRWKAVEFRQFLLYTGVFVLKNNIDSSYYDHFILLHCAYRILSTEQNYLTNIEVANDMLSYFVQLFPLLYGEEKVSFNVHSLLHLAESVQQTGFLNSFSAYAFENFLQKFKKDVRKPSKILQQIYNQNINRCLIKKEKHIGIKKNRFSQITSYSTKQFYLNIKSPDNNVCVNNKPFEISSFYEQGNELFFVGKAFSNLKAYFEHPMNSLDLGIGMADKLLNAVDEKFNVKNIQYKYFKISIDNSHLFIPILHSRNI